MGDNAAETRIVPEDLLSSERPRLVRLCTYLTGDAHAAEDIAQESLLTAWRLEHQLRAPAKRSQWLSGIARNLSLHWRRRRGLEIERLAHSRSSQDEDPWRVDESVSDAFDVEVELERHELAELLDRAMSLLPPDTRDLLVDRYIYETSHAEIAGRLGLTEDTVAKRVERGKLALRRVLTTQLPEEAATYGLQGMTDGWQETRIWCPLCGGHRVLGRFDRARGHFSLRCPECSVQHLMTYLWHSEDARVLSGVKGYRAALSRLMVCTDDYYRQALTCDAPPCEGCGHPTPLRMGLPADVVSEIGDVPGIHQRCEACGANNWAALSGLARCQAEARAFWRDHPRIRTLPEREVEVSGSPALVVGFESTRDRAKLDVVVARDTLRLIGVHRNTP